MDSNEVLAIIAAAIALSAYLSTVRFRLFDKQRRGYATALMIADVPLVATVLILATSIGLQKYTACECETLTNVGVGTFAFALLALTGFHVYEWGISLGWWK